MILLSSFLTSPVISSGTDDEGTVNAFQKEAVVFDNGMDYDGLYAAQWDENLSFDAYPADDFQFDEDTQVNTVNWIGGYYNDNYSQGDFDWNVTFYYDRGDGGAPGSVYVGPYTYTPDQYNQTFLENDSFVIYYEFSVYLPTTLTFTANEKYWISIYGVGAFPPQSGWGYNDTLITLHQAVFKSYYFLNHSYWNDTIDVFGTASDMCFQLISTEQNATVITINNEYPAKNSLNVSIYAQNVSAYISITLTQETSDFIFAWRIGGDNITTTTNLSDHTEGRKGAPIHGPLEYNTTYDWYVNVSFGGQYKNVTFKFTTEKKPNQPPVANFTWTIKDLTVTFTSTSTDSDNDIVNWTWNFGDVDVNSRYGKIIQHIYAQNGTYDVNLTVRDSGGKTNSVIKAVDVTNNPPVANITYALVGSTKIVQFYASNSYDINGTIVSYFWEFGDEKNSTNMSESHNYDQDYKTYKVNLTVKDSAGLTNTISKNVTIGDVTSPTIEITKPVKKTIYVNNQVKRQRLLGMPIIIGDITIEVNAKDNNGSGIAKVDFYINGKLKGNDTTAPYNYTWKKDRLRFFHLFTIKVVAYDKAGNSATAKIVVKKYL